MKNMKRKFFPVLLTLLALLVCLFSLAACGETGITGKYVNPEVSTDVYELKDGNAWSHSDQNGTYVYTQEDGSIIFKTGDAQVATGTLKDGVLTVGDKTFKQQASGNFFSRYGVFIILAVFVVLLIVWFVFSGRKNKSRQKEYVEQIEAIRPGNKVKSAGGLCGVVVEVCDDDTVVIETGSETAGKSYFKLAKESIYQTDAKGPTQIAREQAEADKLAQKSAQVSAKEPVKETKEEPKEEHKEEPLEEPFEEIAPLPEEKEEPAEEPLEEPAEEPSEDEDGKTE